jgi:DNA repair exonuclease SbcCD ATPase subunit
MKTDKEDFLPKMEANQEEMKANRKADQEKAEADRKAAHEDLMAKMEADRSQTQEMIKMLHANQNRTDAKLEGLSDRIEKIQMALQTAEMCREATTRRLKEDLTNNCNETCEAIEEAKREFRDRLQVVQTRTEGESHPRSARAQSSHRHSTAAQHGACSDDSSRP